MKTSNKIIPVSLKGTKPQTGGSISLKNGTVMSARLKFDNIEVSYDGKKAELGNHYYIGEEVYFDPTGKVTDCNAGIEWTESNTGTTCYKWNIIKDKGSSIEMLLDHNTTTKIAWNSSNDNTSGPLEVYEQLKTDTASWSRVETLTTSDNVTRENASRGTYVINYNSMKARLISGKEIASIVQNSTWSASGYSIYVSLRPWLYQNLREENINFQPACYWSDTASGLHSTSAWRISWDGRYDFIYANNNSRCGIRPVARVLKSNI